MKIENNLKKLENLSKIKTISNERLNPKINFKRLLDLTLSILILPIILPIMVLISLLIKIDSKGSIFFIQERLGKDFNNFNCFKFRTMYENSQEIFDNHLIINSDALKEWEKYKKLKEDPRITKLGKFLRKTSLDELPQIINVLKGEMSLVGPRPYLPAEADDMKPYLKDILSVIPGITGLWQVSGRNKLSFEDRLKLDSLYASETNIIQDISILFKTIKVVLLKEGAY